VAVASVVVVVDAEGSSSPVKEGPARLENRLGFVDMARMDGQNIDVAAAVADVAHVVAGIEANSLDTEEVQGKMDYMH
jgi:hypothetical protein